MRTEDEIRQHIADLKAVEAMYAQCRCPTCFLMADAVTRNQSVLAWVVGDPDAPSYVEVVEGVHAMAMSGTAHHRN